jgi:hypothetical protein
MLGVGGVVAALAALGTASSAQAAISATVAPIGSASSGDHLMTIKNEGPKTEGAILIELSGGEEASGVAPSTCAYGQPVAGTLIGCGPIDAGATLQVCYHGPTATAVTIFYSGAPAVPLSKAGAVGSCPVPGFRPSSGGSGGFSLGKAKDDPKTGTAKLSADVPGAGTVKLSGPGVRTVTARATAAGKVDLTVTATAQKATELDQTGKVTIKATVTFTPAGGKASLESTTFKLVKN